MYMARIRERPDLWTTLRRQTDITVELGAWGNSGESQRSYGRSSTWTWQTQLQASMSSSSRAEYVFPAGTCTSLHYHWGYRQVQSKARVRSSLEISLAAGLTLRHAPLHFRDTLMVLIQGRPEVWLDYPKFSAVSSGFSHSPQNPCSRFPAGGLQRHTVSTLCLIYGVKFSPRCG